MPFVDLVPADARPAVSNEETVWNVAYGSNLSIKKLTSRAPDGRKKISPLSQHPVTVPGYKLEFRLGAIPPCEPVMANARKSDDGPMLHGVAYELTKEDYDTLCMSEHCATSRLEPSYRETPVAAYAYGSPVEISATIFTHAREDSCRVASAAGNAALYGRYLHPSERYLKLLRDGARAAELDPAYREWLETLPPARLERFPPMVLAGNLALAGAFLVFQMGTMRRCVGALKSHVIPRLIHLYVLREEAADKKQVWKERVLGFALAVGLFPLIVLGVINMSIMKTRVLMRE